MREGKRNELKSTQIFYFLSLSVWLISVVFSNSLQDPLSVLVVAKWFPVAVPRWVAHRNGGWAQHPFNRHGCRSGRTFKHCQHIVCECVSMRGERAWINVQGQQIPPSLSPVLLVRKTSRGFRVTSPRARQNVAASEALGAWVCRTLATWHERPGRALEACNVAFTCRLTTWYPAELSEPH